MITRPHTSISDDAFFKTLVALPEQEKFAFTIEHSNCIREIRELLVVLKTLPEYARFTCAEYLSHKIVDAFDLANVIHYLFTDDEKNSFANKYDDRVKDIRHLLIILRTLPIRSRLEFAMKHSDKISAPDQEDVLDLTMILDVLSYDDRVKFAETHRNHIYSFLHLILVLQTFKPNTCFAFANKCFDKILNKNECQAVAEYLPLELRTAFVENYARYLKIKHWARLSLVSKL